MIVANKGIILSDSGIDDIEDAAIERILQWVHNDPEKARQLTSRLSALDWKLIIAKKQQEKLDERMDAMEYFLQKIKKGAGLCDWCKEFCTKLYSWPFISKDSRVNRVTGYQSDMQIATHQKLCWKCFHKHQEYVRWDRLLMPCDACNRLIPYKARIHIKDNNYCLHCVEQAVETQFIYCSACNKKTASSIKGLCYDCFHFRTKYPYTWQVSAHCERARKAGTPATLTVEQWAATVAYFNGKCAYCRSRPLQVLEHFLPIVHGGGTTQENCVPACNKCNSRKGSAHPNTFNRLFLPDVIEHIKQYLRGELPQRVSTLAVSNRALIVI